MSHVFKKANQLILRSSVVWTGQGSDFRLDDSSQQFDFGEVINLGIRVIFPRCTVNVYVVCCNLLMQNVIDCCFANSLCTDKSTHVS